MSKSSDFISNNASLIFTPKRVNLNRLGTAPDGFLRNGDMIITPTYGAEHASYDYAALVYKNNNNTTVWSKTAQDLSGSGADRFLSMTMEDDLLWVTTYDGTADIIYLATINAAGTVDVKGNTGAVGFAIYGWGYLGSGTNIQVPTMYRSAPGSSVFQLDLVGRTIAIGATDGSLHTAGILTNINAGAIRTTSGVYVSLKGNNEVGSAADSSTGHIEVRLYIPPKVATDPYLSSTVYLPLDCGLPFAANDDTHWAFLRWNDEILIYNFYGCSPVGCIYDESVLIKQLDALVSRYSADMRPV